MKKNYTTPTLEVEVFLLNGDILGTSNVFADVYIGEDIYDGLLL